MKIRLFLALFAVSTQLVADCNHTSQITLFTRPADRHLALYTSFWDDVVNCKQGQRKIAVQCMPFYEKSHGNNCIGSYFLVNNKSIITVVGDNAPVLDVVNRDVRAEWLGLDDNFEGIFTVEPHQKQVGAVLEFNLDVYTLIPWEFLKTWWIDIALPIFNVKNRLATKNSSPEVVTALQNNGLKFAKFANGTTEKTGVGEASINLGGMFLYEDGFLLSYYGGFGVPGERAPRPQSLFPATLGNEDHWAILAGFALRMPVIEWCDGTAMRFFLDLENRYYLSTHQVRTFDLRHKQWSRYMPVRQQDLPQTQPAANVLTFCAKVKPHSFAELTTGLEFSNEFWHLEIGYDLWTHAREQIKFADDYCCPKTPPYFTRFGLAGSTAQTSASNSTIAHQAPDDITFVTIKPSDIDLDSGGSSGTVVQGAHAALYALLSTYFVGLGGFYETANNNAALTNWGLWGKIGAEF